MDRGLSENKRSVIIKVNERLTLEVAACIITGWILLFGGPWQSSKGKRAALLIETGRFKVNQCAGK